MNSALRPMTTGEVLDRTFSLYRNNFILFAGIGVLPPALKLILDFVQLPFNMQRISGSAGVVATGGNLDSSPFGPGAFLLILVYLLGLIVAAGATVYAVSMVYLGKTTSINESYKGIMPYIMKLIGIFLLMVVIFIGLGIVVVGVPVFALAAAGSIALTFLIAIIGAVILFHLYVCLSVATSACVVEKAGVIDSLKRSMALTKGSRGRIWLVFLLTFVLNVALSFALVALVGAIAAGTRSVSLALIVLIIGQFLVGTLVAPIFTIALVLVYYDQRVRKEAFDLQLMMEALGQTPEQATAAAPIG